MTRKHSNTSDIEAIFYDKVTRDEVENIALVIPRRKETVKDWLMIFHRGAITMALDAEIRKETYRVFMYILGHLEFENKLLISQNDIARGMDIKQQCVNRAFKQLTQKGILLEDKKYGTVKTYKLNTEYGWKGTVKNLKKQAVEETKQKNAA